MARLLSLFLLLTLVELTFLHAIAKNFAHLNITCQYLPALSAAVWRPGTRSVMYIITHDEASDAVARRYIDCYNGSDWMHIARSPESVYFESLIYTQVFPSSQTVWAQFDYVITATYKTLTRQLMPRILPIQTFKNVLDLLAETRRRDYDVAPFLRQDENMLASSYKYHKQGFINAWVSLLRALGYNDTAIENHSNVRGFYRNVFIIKPVILQKLNAFMTKAVAVVEKSPQLQSLLRKDARYVMGKVEVAKRIFGTHYYQLYPFVFERLPIFYLNAINASICMHESGICKYNYKG